MTILTIGYRIVREPGDILLFYFDAQTRSLRNVDVSILDDPVVLNTTTEMIKPVCFLYTLSLIHI